MEREDTVILLEIAQLYLASMAARFEGTGTLETRINEMMSTVERRLLYHHAMSQRQDFIMSYATTP